MSRKLGVTIYNDDEIDLFNDIDGLLNLAGACDFIISIDNTTIHLAGAAGINTHVLLNRGLGTGWMVLIFGTQQHIVIIKKKRLTEIVSSSKQLAKFVN